ncbi:MAG TPA: hypothetical protein VLJ62_20495 [Burkholderiaceae bacterium]|nr:hypothetical protein [Burkholderiaceae bacterium]
MAIATVVRLMSLRDVAAGRNAEGRTALRGSSCQRSDLCIGCAVRARVTIGATDLHA